MNTYIEGNWSESYDISLNTQSSDALPSKIKILLLNKVHFTDQVEGLHFFIVAPFPLKIDLVH